MRKKIYNKVYDTVTANRVMTATNRKTRGAKDFVEVSLYKKRTGEFFFYYEYTEAPAKITPCTIESARTWLSKNASKQRYNEIIGQDDYYSKLSPRKLRPPVTA